MKSAIDWFKELGVPFDGDITIKDIINIQEDAFDAGRVSGLRESALRVQWAAIPHETKDCCRKVLCETYQAIEQLQIHPCSKKGETDV